MHSSERKRKYKKRGSLCEESVCGETVVEKRKREVRVKGEAKLCSVDFRFERGNLVMETGSLIC